MLSEMSLLHNTQKKGPDTFRPQLTSLVDVMTILLVFLIKSFSVEGNLITPAEDLQLPLSTSEKTPEQVVSLEITRSTISGGGEAIVTVPDVEDRDSLMIPSLFEWMQLQKSLQSDTAGTNRVMIQSDREIEFKIIKQVMYTCSKAGFHDFSVLVLQDE